MHLYRQVLISIIISVSVHIYSLLGNYTLNYAILL